MHSFAPGTLVLLADGSLRPIEKLQPGDRVVATDPETGHKSAQEVVATHINLDLALTDLTIAAKSGTAIVETTANHPFWSQDRSDWIEAAKLLPGERLRTSDGSAMTVTQARSYFGQKVMYDLTIDTTHTYYVQAGTDASVLVHNCGKSASIGNKFDVPNRPGVYTIHLADGKKICGIRDWKHAGARQRGFDGRGPFGC